MKKVVAIDTLKKRILLLVVAMFMAVAMTQVVGSMAPFNGSHHNSLVPVAHAKKGKKKGKKHKHHHHHHHHKMT